MRREPGTYLSNTARVIIKIRCLLGVDFFGGKF